MRILGLTLGAFIYDVVFTVVEVVTLVGWLVLAGLPFHYSDRSVAAVVVLTVGLFVEHTLSLRAGRENKF